MILNLDMRLLKLSINVNSDKTKVVDFDCKHNKDIYEPVHELEI